VWMVQVTTCHQGPDATSAFISGVLLTPVGMS
jgi:hypothetical protein